MAVHRSISRAIAPRRGFAVPAAVAGGLVLGLATTPAHAAPAAHTAAGPTGAASAFIRPAVPTKAVAAQTVVRAVAAAPESYTVVAGDTVWAIANRHGLSVAAVLSQNGLTAASVIYPGDVLRLGAAPAPAAESAEPAPAPAAEAPAAPAAPAPAPAASHEVAAGDTLWSIANRHGLGLDALFAANGLSRDSIIYPGQRIAIPTAGAPAAAPAAAAAPAPAAAPAAPAQSSAELDAEQAANAAAIISVGRSLGVSDRAIQIALGTAMVESSLRNVSYGDRDSLGLFQQRPSQGWGTAAEVQDADRAARAFFGGSADPNGTRTKGLLDIAGWESMSYAAAAQAVQISAFPDRYAAWEQASASWLAAHG